MIKTSWKRLLVLTIGFSAVAVLAGCSGSDSGSSSSSSGGTVTPKAGSTVSATVGKPFVIKLESNPTTGYSWTVKRAAPNVRFIDSTYEAPKQDAVGAPGQQLLKFQGVKAGTGTVALVYERPFAPGEPGKSLTFTVDVAKS